MNNSISNQLTNRESIALAQIRSYFIDSWDKIIIFFTSYQWKELIFALKTASIIICLILGFLIIVLLIKINIKAGIRSSVEGSKKPIFFNKKRISKKWLKTEKRLGTGIEANYKLAVLEADNIFEDVLKNLGYEADIRISNLDEIKQAGKVKNNIIEDSKFNLTESEAQKIVAAYKKGLEDLGAI